MEISPEIIERIRKLQEKFDKEGQDMASYLDGLLYSEYINYWDYIHLDTLLSLQVPRTFFPDEKIFIMYHQVTELYFKMILSECEQICDKEDLTEKFFYERMMRINRYFQVLTSSFDIMVDGMEKEQFLKYRLALQPASGFQSGQYRMIEIYATDLINLVDKDVRETYRHDPFDAEKFIDKIYWKHGATELETGKKTLTLRQFEQKYLPTFTDLAKARHNNNIYTRYRALNSDDQKLKDVMRQFDINVNVNWPLVHYKSAARYLQKDPHDIMATGGTNWQKYLPPRFQKRIFYPELWSDLEIEEWGRGWVESVIAK